MYSPDVALCLVEQVRQTAVWDFPDGPIIEFDSITTSLNRRSLIGSPSVAVRTECVRLSGPALSDVYLGPTVFALVFQLADVCHIYVEWWNELVSIDSAELLYAFMYLLRFITEGLFDFFWHVSPVTSATGDVFTFRDTTGGA